jgi:hypothetical protein
VAYSVDRAALVTKQLGKLATGSVHQLAGQFANLDFWLLETEQALRVLDDYPRRFDLLRDRQQRWVKAHGPRATGPCAHCGGPCELGPQPPRPAVRIPSEDLAAARQGLRDAAAHLLLRLFRLGFIDEPLLRSSCARVGAEVAAAELTASRKGQRAPEPAAAHGHDRE